MMANETNNTDKMRKLFADKELSAAQMEEIVGGTKHENADDSRFLNVLLRGHPAQCDRYGETKCGPTMYGSSEALPAIKRAWKAVGIDACLCYDDDDAPYNEYWLNGHRVSQEEARQHAMSVMGKKLKKSDWYWD